MRQQLRLVNFLRIATGHFLQLKQIHSGREEEEF